jgi:hypothetical protein
MVIPGFVLDFGTLTMVVFDTIEGNSNDRVGKSQPIEDFFPK